MYLQKDVYCVPVYTQSMENKDWRSIQPLQIFIIWSSLFISLELSFLKFYWQNQLIEIWKSGQYGQAPFRYNHMAIKSRVVV